ncbi:hypothetical protein CFC21_039122 [Triticum aestivum]|uniref:RING-type E3 ubiquitin transferase n=2 Tax=Triticum aestivum TaxID=4565 RepID=A0A9R1JRJ8_WHEAT|nr:putative E3 ubiquitin-protein ligase SINA-like 6 [Triticum aestivum]KAF7027050.1 hypothetical protein CFC21_039122 [Triticum aestivum]
MRTQAASSAMEMELPNLNVPVKQEIVVHTAGAQGRGGGGGAIAEASEHGTRRTEPTVRIEANMLDCPICSSPFKPPVFQCKGGHLACGSCVAKLPWKQCQRCDHGGDFHGCPFVDAFVSSARMKCDHHGCGRQVTYHKLDDHKSACPLAPCKCPVSGCGFEGPPPALRHHLSAVHSMPVHAVQYGKVLQLEVPVSEPRRLLFAEEDGRAFLVVGGSLGLGVPIALSVVCIRAGASPPPHYVAKVWANGPPAAANDRTDTVRADIQVTSSKEPGAVAVEELTFLTVPHKLLAGAGPSRAVSLHLRIDKITS